MELSGNEQLQSLVVSNNPSLAAIDLTKANTLTGVSLTDDPALKTVTWGTPDKVNYLYLNNSAFEAFPLNGFTALSQLYISGCTSWGKTLDVSGLTRLYTIDMGGTGIETLIAKNTPGLSYNSDWPVKTVDFSEKGVGDIGFNGPEIYDEALQSWVPADNALETIIVKDCKELTSLSIYRLKNLKSVELSGNEQLQSLNVSNNPSLAAIDLTGDKALQSVSVYDNTMLNNLDVRPLSALYNLDCHNNALVWLDLSKNTNLNYWYNVEQPQHPQMNLVTLSSDKVAYAVHNDFDATKVKNLKTNGKAFTPAKVTVDGQAHFVVTSQAAGITGKNVSYDYLTGYNYDGTEQPLKVEGTVLGVTKGATRIYLSATTAKGTYGETITAPVATTSEFYDGKLSYASDNTSVVTLNAETGALTVVGAGTATITVSGNETAYRLAPEAVTYTVTIAKASPVFAFANAAVEATCLDAVPANVLTKGVYDGKVVYTSSNNDVATVDDNGKVTTKAGGTVTITASGEETANCNKPTPAIYTLTVKKREATITLAADEVSGTYGGTIEAPKATVTNGYDGKLTYTSGNEQVVKVDADGKLTITGAGETTVTVSGKATSVYKAAAATSFKVVIAKGQPEFSFAEAIVEANDGETLEVNELEKGFYDGQVTYTSSDTKIAEVNATTGVVTTKKMGTVTITATGAETKNCLEATASYEVKVLDCCDVNLDGSVDVADIATIISEMAGSGNSDACDVNKDHAVDVADIATVISRMAELARMQRTVE